jgi:hypothetical protein
MLQGFERQFDGIVFAKILESAVKTAQPFE